MAVNIVKYGLALLYTWDLQTPLNAVAHLHCNVEYSVLTMQLPQHYTRKTKHHLPYTIVAVSIERKQLHES